jgi:hypothetical protein
MGAKYCRVRDTRFAHESGFKGAHGITCSKLYMILDRGLTALIQI